MKRPLNLSHTDYRVLLYYKFIHIENPEEYAHLHLRFCERLGLKGRILVAEEGLNGTVSGTHYQTECYKSALRMDPRFTDIEIKEEEVNKHAFKKMHVRHREEIVTFQLDEPVNPIEDTGEYLKPEQFYEELQKEDVIILDGRSDYDCFKMYAL
jgi:UPF0176 protein